jgi:hypothetical protein
MHIKIFSRARRANCSYRHLPCVSVPLLAGSSLRTALNRSYNLLLVFLDQLDTAISSDSDASIASFLQDVMDPPLSDALTTVDTSLPEGNRFSSFLLEGILLTVILFEV